MTQLWATSEYPRGSQDSNQVYSGSQAGLSHYPNENTVSYLHSEGQARYSATTPQYSSYSPTYAPNQSANAALMYMPSPATMQMPYHIHPPPSATVPSQHRPPNPFYQSNGQSQRLMHQQLRLPGSPEISLTETEEQESLNNETMRSEPIHPPMEGYPLVEDFDDLIRGYVDNLSPKKQDKALIHARRAANIKAVLIDKKTTSVESAQFRFWVKKMFTLEPRDPSIPARKKKICHEGKPVAIREKLFKILTRAHKQCQHGGRDKTSAQVRRVYSWVPKELISRFVKLCPTCRVRRGTSRNSHSASENSTGAFMDPHSPGLSSSSRSRRSSVVPTGASGMHSPVQMSRFSSMQQNRWMTPLQSVDKGADRVANLENAASAMTEAGMGSSMSFGAYETVSSKCTNDPGTPYMSDDMLQHADINSQYQLHNVGMQNTMYHIHPSNHPYRIKRESNPKQEPRY